VSLQNAGGIPGQYLQIAVSDTGPGVPEEFRDQIFEKFFRVEHHEPKSLISGQGAGFGLYLCRQIVEAHGGRIRCEVREDQPGTTVALEIPADNLGLVGVRRANILLSRSSARNDSCINLSGGLSGRLALLGDLTSHFI
jgi:nitrogen-specific signal transduction histidine kinase